ncbi:Ppx/GppA phosphatase family protein [Fulvivirga lutea]|uniref:Exopolyphosphatase n=1 Tax=Fulvivirga lutea TaxID=2810512 RepID=A0A975A0Z7_9BACT|nr:exopolyphosphatase [Fulvivirga lutea]QSE97761.1 exopolyphosphatase [Fulvivirga lutea]
MKKIALIDCGTNTFHLMIAELGSKNFRIIERIKKAVKIGAGGINNQTILLDAQDRAIEALSSFSERIINEKIEEVHAFATSAFRNATNGEDIKKSIFKITGIDVSIITGDREAELIFKGVSLALNLDEKPALVMDIGGGSVEFIIGNNKEISWKRSFEIGGQRLVELFHKSDPIDSNEMKALDQYFDENLGELVTALSKYKPLILAGSSGTFDTLSEIYCKENGLDFDENKPELPLTLSSYLQIHQKLINKTREERMQIPGMIEIRVDMIVVASCLINYLVSKYKFESVRVSTYSLKEGALAELMNQNSDGRNNPS